MLDLRRAVTDAPLDEEYVRIRCVNHAAHKNGDASPAMAVYPDGLYCFACGFTASGKEALSLLRGGAEVEDGLTFAPKRTVKPAKQLDPLPAGYAKLYNLWLNSHPEKLEWLLGPERGLTRETVNEYQLGYDGAHYCIPVFNAERQLMTFRYRMDPAVATEEDLHRSKYFGWRGRNDRFLYPAWMPLGSWCVLCEGEFDALVLRQDGVPAITLTNGARQMKRIPLLLPYTVRQVVIVCDNDPAGYESRDATIRQCQLYRIPVTTVALPGQHKDVTKAYQAGWRFPKEKFACSTLATA